MIEGNAQAPALREGAPADAGFRLQKDEGELLPLGFHRGREARRPRPDVDEVRFRIF